MKTSEKGHPEVAQAPEVVKTLIDNGAEVNTIDKDGKTVLMYASANNRLQVVQTLLNKGADINAKDEGIWGWTALMYASWAGHRNVVQALIDKGADVNAKDKDGLTARTIASRSGQREVADLLRQAGAKE